MLVHRLRTNSQPYSCSTVSAMLVHRLRTNSQPYSRSTVSAMLVHRLRLTTEPASKQIVCSIAPTESPKVQDHILGGLQSLIVDRHVLP